MSGISYLRVTFLFLNVKYFYIVFLFLFFRHPRHKKYIKQICEEMREVRNDKQKPAVILYSLVDYHYIILL